MSIVSENLRAAAAATLHTITPTSGGGAVTADQISASATDLAQVEIVNTGNPSDTVYVKLYNAQSGNVTVVTTTPQMVLPCPGGATVTYIVPQEVSFSAALTVVAVTAGGTAGTTSMTNSVTIKLLQG